MNAHYDVRGLVKAFGGRTGIIEKLKRGADVIIKINAVDKWIERGSIPGHALIDCERAATKLQLGFSITDFIITEREVHAS